MHTHQQAFEKYFTDRGLKAFDFQLESFNAIVSGKSGVLNAPTGSGKTLAIALPFLVQGAESKKKGAQVIWITPIRALAQDLERAIGEAACAVGCSWRVATRSGDTSAKERAAQKLQLPEFLITTPESLHLLLAQKNYLQTLSNLQAVVVDEWHELIGNKRGVQIELGLSRLKAMQPTLQIWGISATIGNLEEACDVLMGSTQQESVLIKADIEKKIQIRSLIPDDIENLPWAGHLGTRALIAVRQLLNDAGTTLIFTNTRSQAEIWYKQLIELDPDLAGIMAMHHGSLSQEVRAWVEASLHEGSLKAVLCTSSLDLGVDFRPVDQVIQIGSPKGIARFLQRAGRSGHRPGAVSNMWFVPTHALELLEACALRKSIGHQELESRIPMKMCFDVLCQYLTTLAVSDGFDPNSTYLEVKSTACFSEIEPWEWQWVIHFLTQGGDSLQAYDEFSKLTEENGKYYLRNRRLALRHRLSMGTIVSDTSIKISLAGGKYLGTIEESFISKLKPGDVFWFAGKCLELIQVKEMTARVRKVPPQAGLVPSWMGGRMPLSGPLSKILREEMQPEKLASHEGEPEIQALLPLLQLQKSVSLIPGLNQLLIEKLETSAGFHVFVYPFEGRLVHEGLAGLTAYRIGQWMSITFSIAMNDHGFELLSDQPIPIEEALGNNVFGLENLGNDLLNSVNGTEMARRKFRDIAGIAGLIFQGYPGKSMPGRHLQASSSLFFEVFREHEPNNLLLRQAYAEVLEQQMEEVRMLEAIKRIENSEIIIKELQKPSPFCYPIMVDNLNREHASSETLEDRVKKMSRSREKKVRKR